MNTQALEQALLQAVRAQGFEHTADSLLGGAPVDAHPSIDLAVARFAPGAAPVWANVLFSREHPQGFAATIGPHGGAVSDVAFFADLQDAAHNSPAWQPGADWSALPFKPFFGQGPRRFVCPYPGSLVKMMVLVGVARAVDAGRTRWEQPLSESGQTRAAADWAFDMTAISCNRATDVLVAHLHAIGVLDAETHGPHELHRVFAGYGLPGLRIARTRADGGWRNDAGAGVGQLQMTAWDALRLFWLIDPNAPPPPWLPAGHAPLLAGSREHVMHCLRSQRLHHILSSGALRTLPGTRDWQAGIPDDDGCFAHKTGNTENYSSNAGIVRIDGGDHPRHYLVALTSNLGSRYAVHPEAATTPKLQALGAAIDRLMQ